jgi:uncharacterized protein
MYFALRYETGEDYLARREPLRTQHLALAKRWQEDGRLLMAGAFNPPQGALLIFQAKDRAEVETFVREDPYVREGLILRWHLHEWTVVIPPL